MKKLFLGFVLFIGLILMGPQKAKAEPFNCQESFIGQIIIQQNGAWTYWLACSGFPDNWYRVNQLEWLIYATSSTTWDCEGGNGTCTPKGDDPD